MASNNDARNQLLDVIKKFDSAMLITRDNDGESHARPMSIARLDDGPDDMAHLDVEDGAGVDLIGEAGDGVSRVVRGMRATAYDVPRGSCAGYYPECNPLLPLWHHAEGSKVPAAKSIPVRIEKRT